MISVGVQSSCAMNSVAVSVSAAHADDERKDLRAEDEAVDQRRRRRRGRHHVPEFLPLSLPRSSAHRNDSKAPTAAASVTVKKPK